MGEGLSECRIAHGDEGEGVVSISMAFFHSFGDFGRRLAAREDPFGGGDIVPLLLFCCFVVDRRTVSSVICFVFKNRNLKFERS